MQYIKQYNSDLFDKILLLQKQEYKRNFIKNIFNRKVFLSKWKEKLIIPPKEHVDEVVEAACEYMNISRKEYVEIIEKFTQSGFEIKECYENQSQANIFWNNVNIEWLCINIYVQSVLYNTAIPIYSTLKKMPLNNLTAYDYGCGSGILSILLNKAFHFKKLILADIDNYIAGFVKFYIQKTSAAEIYWENILENNRTESFDLVICLDVLEHLENSYDHLLILDSKVNKGGIMVLKIAFEHEDKTHLPQAAEDFFVKNDGMFFLKQKYKRLNYFGGGLVNGVYKKK